MSGPSMAGRVALLTGASGGIGGALGRRLLQAGVHTALTYGRSAEQVRILAGEAEAHGVRAVALPGDLADPAVPARLVRQAVASLGHIDVLIANAGHAVRQEYAEVDLETWNTTIAVNLTAPFLLAQEVLPGMVERGFGRVLFISSVAGFTGGIIGPHYAASKAGVHGLVHFLAPRVGQMGVTVNALAPALIENTAMLPVTARPRSLPVGRFGTPDEVADLAMAILGNGYLTNQVLSLDGGSYPR